jgi:N,N'-diacetyllegionaminate synthase
MKINNRKIGQNNPCFIIAEAGVNHNGKISCAKKLVDIAVTAGADAVKFQTYKSEGVVIDNIGICRYQKENIGKEIKQIDMIKEFELSYDDFCLLKKYCDEKNIIFLSTPHSFDAIDFLEDKMPMYKFGSGDITNIPALTYAAKKQKPIILGTGMSTLQEINQAIDAIKNTGNHEIIILHCTTNYPCPFDEVNLNVLKTLSKELKCLIGYSDHTMGLTVPIMAVTLGACVLEKHFTINRTLPGPDHKASLEPDELTKMIKYIREVEIAMGSYEKIPTKSEIKIKDIIRKSIVSATTITKGTIIKKEHLTIKRPGTGIQPFEMEKLIGKQTKKTIKNNTIITWDDIQ